MRNIDPYIRIVCEGRKTEPNYFNSLLRSRGYKFPNPASKAKDHSPIGVAREAKNLYKEAVKLKIPHELIHIWAVFDHDEHSGIPEAFNMLGGSKIRVVFSNICFEYWILLHYEYTTRQFWNSDELVNHILRNHDGTYTKANNHFDRLKDKLPTAIENATRLIETHWAEDDRPPWEKNPYTNAHELIQSL